MSLARREPTRHRQDSPSPPPPSVEDEKEFPRLNPEFLPDPPMLTRQTAHIPLSYSEMLQREAEQVSQIEDEVVRQQKTRSLVAPLIQFAKKDSVLRDLLNGKKWGDMSDDEDLPPLEDASDDE